MTALLGTDYLYIHYNQVKGCYYERKNYESIWESTKNKIWQQTERRGRETDEKLQELVKLVDQMNTNYHIDNNMVEDIKQQVFNSMMAVNPDPEIFKIIQDWSYNFSDTGKVTKKTEYKKPSLQTQSAPKMNESLKNFKTFLEQVMDLRDNLKIYLRKTNDAKKVDQRLKKINQKIWDSINQLNNLIIQLMEQSNLSSVQDENGNYIVEKGKIINAETSRGQGTRFKTGSNANTLKPAIETFIKTYSELQQIVGLTDLSTNLQGLLGEEELKTSIQNAIDDLAGKETDKILKNATVERTGDVEMTVLTNSLYRMQHWTGTIKDLHVDLSNTIPTKNKADVTITYTMPDQKIQNFGIQVKSVSQSVLDRNEIEIVGGTHITALFAFNLRFFNVFANYYNKNADGLNNHNLDQKYLEEKYLVARKIILMEGLMENFSKIQQGADIVDAFVIKNVSTGEWSVYSMKNIIDMIKAASQYSTTLNNSFRIENDITYENALPNKYVIKDGISGYSDELALERVKNMYSALRSSNKYKISAYIKPKAFTSLTKPLTK